jgi:hypothetical protein
MHLFVQYMRRKTKMTGVPNHLRFPGKDFMQKYRRIQKVARAALAAGLSVGGFVAFIFRLAKYPHLMAAVTSGPKLSTDRGTGHPSADFQRKAAR